MVFWYFHHLRTVPSPGCSLSNTLPESLGKKAVIIKRSCNQLCISSHSLMKPTSCGIVQCIRFFLCFICVQSCFIHIEYYFFIVMKKKPNIETVQAFVNSKFCVLVSHWWIFCSKLFLQNHESSHLSSQHLIWWCKISIKSNS